MPMSGYKPEELLSTSSTQGSAGTPPQTPSLEFRDLGFRDLGLGFRDLGLGFRDLGLGFRDLGFRVSGFLYYSPPKP